MRVVSRISDPGWIQRKIEEKTTYLDIDRLMGKPCEIMPNVNLNSENISVNVAEDEMTRKRQREEKTAEARQRYLARKQVHQKQR